MFKVLASMTPASTALIAAVAGMAAALHSARAGDVLPWQEPAAKAAAAAAERNQPYATSPAARSADKQVPSPNKGKADANAGTAQPLVPAKKLFGAVKTPIPLKARAIGFYSKGCLAGAQALPIDGPAWQAMRLSRNRNWGHPKLISLLERFAKEARAKDGWPGLLVGDLSQPRGGPMLTGHASHQLGLDADIWFTPMPSRKLTRKERENLSATSMLSSDHLSVNPKVWGDGQVKIVRRVASYPEVERVLVHPAIKKALCEAPGSERGWLAKVRPYWGHFYHFHVRMGCPKDSPGCRRQDPVSGDDGCGKELDYWYKLMTTPPKPKPKPDPTKPVKPVKPKPPMTLADLPAECRDVLGDGDVVETAVPSGKKPSTASAKPAP
jgi:penicillin-insensitive murein endopeptidase